MEEVFTLIQGSALGFKDRPALNKGPVQFYKHMKLQLYIWNKFSLMLVMLTVKINIIL